MNLFGFFKPIRSAPVARKRLHILLDADRSLNKKSDLIAILRDEIFSRIGCYVAFDPSTVEVKEVNGAAVCTLVIDLEMPKRFRTTAMQTISPARGRPVAIRSRGAAWPTELIHGPALHTAGGDIRGVDKRRVLSAI
jgi:cell division topological specificity factor MinE